MLWGLVCRVKRIQAVMSCPQRLLRFLLLCCAKQPGVGWQGKGEEVDGGWGGCFPAFLLGVHPGAEKYGAENVPVLLDGKCGEAAGSLHSKTEATSLPWGTVGLGELWLVASDLFGCVLVTVYQCGQCASTLDWCKKIEAKLCQSYWRGWEKMGRLSLG